MLAALKYLHWLHGSPGADVTPPSPCGRSRPTTLTSPNSRLARCYSAATVLTFGPAAPGLYVLGGVSFLLSAALQRLALVKLYACHPPHPSQPAN